jgi:hypothetical protein
MPALLMPLVLVEHQRAQLDALARRGIRWRGGIGEGAMRREPGAAIGLGIETLQQQDLVGRHFGYIEPLMVGIVLDRIGLADAIWIDQVGSNEISGFYRAGIAHRQWRVEQRPLDRPPEIDDLDPAFQEFLGLIWQEIADTLRTRTFGVVDMDTRHRLPRAAIADIGRALNALAHGVVEDKHPVGAGGGLDQRSGSG